MSELLAAFRQLPVPAAADGSPAAFTGTAVPRFANAHVAKDGMGRPAVLVRADRPGTGISPPSISLENLRVEHALDCRISLASGETITGRFSLVHCLSVDDGLQEYFLETMQVILQSLPPGVTAAAVSDAVDILASLFAATQRPSSRPTQGLWAELLIITLAREPRLLLQAWHSDPTERYDFSLGSHRLEVKCCADRARRHHFSHEQAHPPAGVTAIVVSVLVEQSASGVSLGELWDLVRSISSDDAEMRLKIERVCLESLGNSWSQARAKSYDQHLATQTLLYFDIADIPNVPPLLPPGVSEVRFRSDLSIASPLTVSAAASRGKLFAASLPAS